MKNALESKNFIAANRLAIAFGFQTNHSVLIVSSLKYKNILSRLPLDKSKDVTRPWTSISVCGVSVLVSQNRILLSKCPLIMVVPIVSDVTRSLQLDPANLVSTPVETKTFTSYVGCDFVVARKKTDRRVETRSWLVCGKLRSTVLCNYLYIENKIYKAPKTPEYQFQKPFDFILILPTISCTTQ